MVTKICTALNHNNIGSVLAKIHMVTKRKLFKYSFNLSSVLAKIHMVTKRRL